MAHIVYSDAARLDLAAAVSQIRAYFEEKNVSELAEKHILAFKTELKEQTKLLRQAPELYPIRYDYYFKDNIYDIRSFTVHWFTVFYTYNKADDEIVIWFVRSTRADLSNVIYLSRTK